LSACATAAGKRIDARAIGELELWCVDTRASTSALRAVEKDAALLSEWERQRAAAFADRALANEWLAAHIAFRVVIERAMGTALRGVRLARSPSGKPQLDGAPIAFNISHVPGLALIALARGGSVGVDVERARAIRVREQRRARIEAAGAALSRAESFAADPDARFLQAWVRLEAFAKAEGDGVGRLFTRLGISGNSARTHKDFRARLDGVLAETSVAATRDVALGEGVFAAVASGSAQAIPEVFRLPEGKSAIAALLA
jgi:4'-phosphopantetheinyl transferase